jgi:transcription termination/antitermination protein NusA
MNRDFISALSQIERERGISKEVLIQAIEAALISAYRRNAGTAQNVAVNIDRQTGEVKVWERLSVVDEVVDIRNQIERTKAVELVGGHVDEFVDIEVTPRDFGRIAAQTAKQVVVQRIREAERGVIYEEFSNREGDIVTGIVQRLEGRTAIVDLGKAEAVLMASEQVHHERLKMGDRIKTYVTEVKRTTKGPQIVVSRTHPGLLKRLLELEVPEIHDGIVEIRAIAREPGSRSKVAVYSRDLNVDPVGACVGQKGTRIQAIVSELKGEKIDIVRWDPDPATFVGNALSPARVVKVEVDEEQRVAHVVVPEYQLSLAIGREGQNARLTAKLTGVKVDIKSESQARADGDVG